MKSDRKNWFLSTKLTAMGIVALLVPTQLAAQQSYSPQELALVPEYCKYTQIWRDNTDGGKSPEKVQQWQSAFGGTSSDPGIFLHMHHYCWGLTHVNHAKFWVKTAQERKSQLETSVREFNYVIERSRPGEKMLPEFLTKKGESLLALGIPQSAIVEFERAIELKADYWPPYAAISDYYKGIGNTKLAREVLERGLASSPDSRALSRRLAELGGAKGKPNASSQPPKKQDAPKQQTQENTPESPPQTDMRQSPVEK
jgi:tetratricopeptide (TPR) repeat protein